MIPDFQTIMRPALAALEGGAARPVQEIRERVADVLAVSADDQAVMLASGRVTKYANRVSWALVHMDKAGVVSRPSRGHYAITPRGVQILVEHPTRVDMTVLMAFPEYAVFRTKKNPKPDTEFSPTPAADVEVSPSEAIDQIVRAAEASVAAELLDRIVAQPPVFLERVALRLLQAMGYGGREALLEHTGKPGDAGLDGLIRQDALGIDLVGVQAKRYALDASGRPSRHPGLCRRALRRPDHPRGVRDDRTVQR